MALSPQEKKADKDKDGVLSEKEVRRYNNKNPEDPLDDPFTIEKARAEYGYTVAVIDSDPKLQELFRLAVSEAWEAPRFELEVKQWAREAGYGTGSALDAYKKEKEGGDVWDRTLEQAVGEIKTKALELGVDVGDINMENPAANELVRQWVYGGYSTRPADAVIDFLAPGVGSKGLTGNTASVVESLKSLALYNGVDKTQDWYDQVADSIARGNSDKSYWQNDIRDSAAARFPAYADKIKAGVNVRELASPYLTSISRILERENIDLNDPWIAKAIGGVDEKGNPKPMSMYEFEELLRQSPEWQNTTNGKNTLLNTGTEFLKDMGFLTDNAGMVV